MAPLIRVAVVDDHRLFAEGMVAMLGALDEIEPVGFAETLRDAVILIERTHPDVVLCDVLFGEEPLGFELPTRLLGGSVARTPVLFLSQAANGALLNRAVAAGGSGYMLKTADPLELRAAIITVAGGMTAFPKSVFQQAPDEPRPPSEREAQILRLVADGGSNSEVATKLGISDKTVEAHLSRLFARYGATSRTEMAVMAERRGWLMSFGRQ